MKMILTPWDQYRLSLASADFEELCLTLELRLRAAGWRDLAGALRKNSAALAGNLWNMEIAPEPRRDRRIQRARVQIAKCAADLTAGSMCVPSDAPLWRQGRALLIEISGELDRLTPFATEKARPRLWMN